MARKNPYNPNTEEMKFYSWASGYDSPGSMDDMEIKNPYSEENEPEMFRIWGQGFKANTSRSHASIVSPSSVIKTVVTEQQQLNKPILEATADLTLVPTETLMFELNKRMKTFEETMSKLKSSFGLT